MSASSSLVAAHFLAGSLLTVLIPIALVAVIALYWAVLVRRGSK